MAGGTNTYPSGVMPRTAILDRPGLATPFQIGRHERLQLPQTPQEAGPDLHKARLCAPRLGLNAVLRAKDAFNEMNLA